jgi:hypothetical protein
MKILLPLRGFAHAGLGINHRSRKDKPENILIREFWTAEPQVTRQALTPSPQSPLLPASTVPECPTPTQAGISPRTSHTPAHPITSSSAAVIGYTDTGACHTPVTDTTHSSTRTIAKHRMIHKRQPTTSKKDGQSISRISVRLPPGKTGAAVALRTPRDCGLACRTRCTQGRGDPGTGTKRSFPPRSPPGRSRARSAIHLSPGQLRLLPHRPCLVNKGPLMPRQDVTGD